MCSGWAFLKTGKRLRVGFDGDNWWEGTTNCFPTEEIKLSQ
jgi:hypothetical protein